ncbi:phosphoglycolate phosphatase [Moraxella sp. ZJ142]|uniref:phosphoglycolate phosphatase n=1 Tax=Moraxella marmotae TaxID=3344520 RepID=UPI0035D4F878
MTQTSDGTPAMAGQKSLIIFDLDGTLIDSAVDLAAAVNRMYGKLNLPTMPIDTIKSWVGNGSVKLVERALAAHQQTAQQVDSQALSAAHEIFLAEYACCSTEQTQAYEGVSVGLNALVDAGYTLAICTNKPTRYLPEILAHFGWSDSFTIVIGGDSLAVKKPNPEPLLYICQQLGILPKQAVMVGDSKNDILAAQAANITTLALRYGYNYGEPIDNTNPDMAFDDFNQLIACLLR